MTHSLDVLDQVFALGCATDDPGGLPQLYFAADHQRVNRRRAVIVSVVKLTGLESAVPVELVGSGDEFWAWSHFTAMKTTGYIFPGFTALISFKHLLQQLIYTTKTQVSIIQGLCCT